MISFEPKTKGFNHQNEDFEWAKEMDAFGLFWEPGLGKTKEVLDVAAYRHLRGDIDGLFILAPNGVHRNWISDEVPVHLSDQVRADGLVWYSGRSRSKEQQNEEEWLLNHKGLAIAVMGYDGFARTDNGKDFAKRFLTKRRCMFVLDEAELIKNPSGQRSKLVRGAAKFARLRAILTGTPISNSPFDIYAPMMFLDENFWKKRGIGKYSEFQSYFAIINQISHAGKTWKKIEKYRDLDRLREWIKEITSRRIKEDCLDLPEKLYSKRYFELTPKQRLAYERLKRDYYLQLESGEEVTALLAIVRLIRFAQITSNYIPADNAEEDAPLVPIDEEKNPRLDLLEETVENLEHQGIVWARFQNDFVQIQNRLGDRCRTYYGRTSEKDRIRNIEGFKRGDFQFFVANPATIGRGVTLVNAKTVVYYNNSFRLVDRLQSEDRAHRIGQNDKVQYIDLVAQQTVDEKIVSSLRDKYDIAAYVNGDRLREWI
jgi:SNF2 family DNA or RNA helicase